MLSKVGENVVCVSYSLDLDEMPGYATSHPDPSCLHRVPDKSTVVLGGLRVKFSWNNSK